MSEISFLELVGVVCIAAQPAGQLGNWDAQPWCYHDAQSLQAQRCCSDSTAAQLKTTAAKTALIALSRMAWEVPISDLDGFWLTAHARSL